MNHGIIPYIGGKHRLAHRLVDICAATGADTFVDVFGGSAAVSLAASEKFTKLVYNDIDGDLVNLFRVLATDEQRRDLFKILRWLPPSRRIFDEDGAIYAANGFSFSSCPDPVERARRTFYRHMFAFGGKVRCGGFVISTGETARVKEVQRYRNSLRKLARIGELFRGMAIENLHYSEAIRIHGKNRRCVLYCDPPYDGTEDCYSRSFSKGDHHFLAEQLSSAGAQVVISYYDTPLIRSLYPESRWLWTSIAATKNCCLTRGNKVITSEFVLTKKS